MNLHVPRLCMVKFRSLSNLKLFFEKFEYVIAMLALCSVFRHVPRRCETIFESTDNSANVQGLHLRVWSGLLSE